MDGYNCIPVPKTLYRYILTETIRILAVSSVALVLVMAFATAIKPLTEGMLGADTLFKFVLFMSPSMLQYALPFAAAMGATLVYIRMSQDNEILACQASGLSGRRLAAPMFFLGMVLMVLLLVLSGSVAPALYRKAMQTARGDIVNALVRKLNQGQAFVDEKSGVVLYANAASAEDADPVIRGNLQAETVLQLTGVAVGRLDKKTGHLESDMTASAATAVLYRDVDTGDALVSMRLENPQLAQEPADGKEHHMRASAVDRISFELPNPVGDKVEFLSLGQLAELLRHPARFDDVRQSAAKLSQAAGTERFRRSVKASLSKGVPLRGPLGNETYTLSAPVSREKTGNLLLLSAAGKAKVVVEHRDGAGATLLRRWEAESGEMTFDLDRETGEPVAELKLGTVRVMDPRDGQVVTGKLEHVFDALVWPEPLLVNPTSIGVDQWLKTTESQAAKEPDSALAGARAELLHEKQVLHQRLISQFHIRLAAALVCLLLPILGAAMSLWRRGSLPLVVFFWCFLVAIVSIILINIGGNMAKTTPERFYMGVGLTWLPIVFQAGLLGWIFNRLQKPGI